MWHGGRKLDAAGTLDVPLTEYKALDPHLCQSIPLCQSMEGRFEDALKRYEAEVGEGEEMDESLSEAEEEMEIEATPNEEVVTKIFSPGTTREKNCSAR